MKLTEKKFINIKYVIYDIETLKECFTFCFLDYETKKKKQFIIHKTKNEFNKLIEFIIKLKQNNYYFVGFNNLAFDAQVLQYLFKNNKIFKTATVELILQNSYKFVQDLIALQNTENKYENIVSEKNLIFPQIDLFKQKHYDGKAKRGTSLKWIEFTIGFDNIQEMPIHHSASVDEKDIDLILSYNWNDVEATTKFFELIKFETDLRITLSNEYDLNLLNASEPRLAKEIFAKFLSEESGINPWELKKLRTIRNIINVNEIIFPYIKFQTKELKKVLEEIKQLKIDANNTKGSFEKNFNYHGIETVMGLGGIHACCEPGIYKSNDELIMEDLDVTSMYPNLAIQNDLKPAHLGNSFTKIYNNIFQERRTIPRTDPRNYVYKIVLNSAYGLSNEENSYLYDPLFTMSITINGQLSILMLVEMLSLVIPEIKIYQENTDGVTIGYSPDKKQIVHDICREWEKITKLELENNFYKQMIIMDVNNYIAQDIKGKIKRKGLFEYELDYHKNHSFLVIPKALEAYFINNIRPYDFIKNHNNSFDFFGAVKSKKDFEINLYSILNREFIKEKQQKVCRYYISNKGGRLIKDFHDGRKVSVEASNVCNIINKIENEIFDFNYKYYINEVQKIINLIEIPKIIQTSLFFN